MQIRYASAVVAALLVFPPSTLRAQSAPDPSGHWEGAVKAPGREVNIQIDLTRQPGGAVAGTLTGESVHGFPLSDVAVDRATVRFAINVNGGGSFSGTLADDGKTMTGDFTTIDGANKVPFTLTRTGAATAEPATRNAPISQQLEGTWHSKLEVNGETMRIVLKLSNRPDGTSAGTLANLDQGAVEIPITTIVQKAAGLTLDLTVVSGSYVGEVNADGTALTGTWTQGALVAPLNFRRGETGK